MDEEEFEKLEIPHQSKLKPKDFHLEGTFGPATYKELDNKKLVWVGRISSAYLEWWKRDDNTGKAERHGNRVVSHLSLMEIAFLTNLYVIGSFC